MAFDVRLLGGLTVFNAVVEAGTFVGAGAALGLTQSGVSRSIQRLEEQLNVRLLVRSPRAVILTSEGRKFYEEVKPLLGRLEETAERTRGNGSSVAGHLRLNVDAMFSRLALATKIGKFLELHPRLSVDVCVRTEIGDLIGQGFDLAIRFGEPAASSLIVQRIAQIRVLTCASPEYLKRKGRPRNPAELRGHGHECLLFYDPATRRPFPWEFHSAGKKIKVRVSGRLTFDDGMSQRAACRAGYGVAQVFDFGIDEDLATGRLINLFPKWSEELFPLYLYLPSRFYVPAKVRAFQRFVADVILDRAAAFSSERYDSSR